MVLNTKEVENLKVLVINDEYFSLKMFCVILKQNKINKIDTACNGFEGYNMIKIKDYDLVVCDLNMPVMDGFQFCISTVKHFKDRNKFFDSKLNNNYYIPYLVACTSLFNV